MTNCYSEEFVSGIELTQVNNQDTHGYVVATANNDVDTQLSMLCMWLSMMCCALYVINWAKNRFDSVNRKIFDQHEDIIEYTNAKIEKILAERNKKYLQIDEENSELREYANDLEAKIENLRSMLQVAEVLVSNLQEDISANHAKFGHTITSIRSQNVKDLHDLEGATHTTHLQISNTIDSLMQRLEELDHRSFMTEKHIQLEDEYKSILIGYYDNSGTHPLFCPKHTTELDKYLGDKRVSFILSSLSQLPNYKTFSFADYFYKRDRGIKPISRFMDLHMNVVANAVEWGRAQEVCQPELVNEYKTAFERVKEYCQTFGVNCV